MILYRLYKGAGRQPELYRCRYIPFCHPTPFRLLCWLRGWAWSGCECLSNFVLCRKVPAVLTTTTSIIPSCCWLNEWTSGPNLEKDTSTLGPNAAKIRYKRKGVLGPFIHLEAAGCQDWNACLLSVLDRPNKFQDDTSFSGDQSQPSTLEPQPRS